MKSLFADVTSYHDLTGFFCFSLIVKHRRLAVECQRQPLLYNKQAGEAAVCALHTQYTHPMRGGCPTLSVPQFQAQHFPCWGALLSHQIRGAGAIRLTRKHEQTDM